jgi:hypothetical protein
MAIYHFSVQVISRGKGQSSVASAAYRSGERLTDERTGEVKFYRREVQPETMILAPSHAPEWVYDRQRLWNEVEHTEKRKDARLAREINIALPKELTQDQQCELIRDFVQQQFVDQGMIADIAIHRDDPNNPHAHVMLTTREITTDGFGQKNRDWNKKEMLEQWREQWANSANRALETAGIQERITHLSHEARGLEILPTVHLGYVAHAMEKRGIKTERGDINRERQEYNRLVIDLQKYREEKKIIEQRQKKQEETKKLLTPSEQADIQRAQKLLNKGNITTFSLSEVQKRLEQLDKWEKRLDNNLRYLHWKDEAFRRAGEHFRWIESFENRIQEQQQKIGNLNWVNPLKFKENRAIRENAEFNIAQCKDSIEFHNEKLSYYCEKLGFSNKQEFLELENEYKVERPKLIQKNENQRKQIHYEREILQKAEIAYKNAFIRMVASQYPDHPELQYLSYSDAKKLHALNRVEGRIVLIEDITKKLSDQKSEFQRLQKELDLIKQNQSRLHRAEQYLNHYERYHAIVEKYETNPFLNGKIKVSKSARGEYEDAVSTRDHYYNLMKKEGINDRYDFNKQTELLREIETSIPAIEQQIQFYEASIDLFGAIMNGIAQANMKMQEEQGRRKKTKLRKHQIGLYLDQ